MVTPVNSMVQASLVTQLVVMRAWIPLSLVSVLRVVLA